jgi:AcrR family transcriptional regulator
LKDRFARLREAHRLRDELRHNSDQVQRDRDEALRANEERDRLREVEKARRSGKRPLDAAAIAAAAVAIADAQGIEEVSMRKIAAVLGSGTMSLYHYVKTKDDLLTAMDDLIMGEILVSPHDLKGSWRGAMSAIARSTRDAYRRHPWALTLQTKGRAGINGLKHVEQSLAALASLSLSFEDKLAITIIVDDFVFGHSLRAQVSRAEEEQGANSEAALNQLAEFVVKALNPAQFPVLIDTIGDADPLEFVRRLATFNPGEWFDTGLQAMLDGLAKRYSLND